MSVPWWKIPFDGAICHIQSTKEQFTTFHGQKGVIAVLPDLDMLVVNGLRSEIVIGSSSIIKRDTMVQLLEAAYSWYSRTIRPMMYGPNEEETSMEKQDIKIP